MLKTFLTNEVCRNTEKLANILEVNAKQETKTENKSTYYLQNVCK